MNDVLNFQLLNVVYQEETLRNVIRSVTRNGRSIILTAILALILVYLFSIIGYLFFRDDFLMSVEISNKIQDDESNETIYDEYVPANLTDTCLVNETSCNNMSSKGNVSFSSKSVLLDLMHERIKNKSIQEEDAEEIKERACDSLVLCIITTLNQGLRNGGGIGDILRSPSSKEPRYYARIIYDLLFFFIVIIIILNLIFGVIIDTFADLRSEKQQKEEILKNTCFICGKKNDYDLKFIF